MPFSSVHHRGLADMGVVIFFIFFALKCKNKGLKSVTKNRLKWSRGLVFRLVEKLFQRLKLH